MNRSRFRLAPRVSRLRADHEVDALTLREVAHIRRRVKSVLLGRHIACIAVVQCAAEIAREPFARYSDITHHEDLR
jgi:hypothetical protein